ncbi:hypothetical protein FOMA001_g20169 [Fusarium oxysporum f. sp. matthiolae]|nr:hypothetical protein FOMA001_g20169 [Fusarium oxysporum f. sp. matthiolae]
MKDYGPWRLPHHYDLSDMYDLLYRYARYGSVFLRLEMFLPAMVFFWRALDAVGVVHGPNCTLPDDPDYFVDAAMTILRANLCMLVGLPRKLISPEEFNALDDLGQKLIMSHGQKTWPDFDLAGRDIARRINRAYDVLEAPDVGGPPKSEPRSHNVTSLTEMVVNLSRGENGEQKLALGFRERGLETQLNPYDELEDSDLNAIEDFVAFSRGVPAGQIGVDPVKVERILTSIFKIASRWKAILLLDEADVFLAQRSNDPHLNALVSVFLRELEQYDGILFLTTNRVQSFDEAMISRIHLALQYNPLGPDAREAVWKYFLGQANTKHGSPDCPQDAVDKLAEKELNGREIRNAVFVARSLAQYEETVVCETHLNESISAREQFQRDFQGAGVVENLNSYF